MPEKTTTLGESAVSIGGVDLKSHDHLCALYRGTAERDRLMLPFLRGGQKTLCLSPDGDSERMTGELVGGLPQLDPGLLEVSEPHFTYLGAGTFEPGPMLDFLDAWSATTFEEQKHSVARIAADMCWAEPLATSGAFIADLTDYEACATRWVRSYRYLKCE
jgi:hypothetical protein